MRIGKVFLLLTIILLSWQLFSAQTTKTDSSITIKINNGKYTVSGVVADENSRNEIIEKVSTQLSGNTDFSRLKSVSTATPFKSEWQKDFDRSLLKLKNWKTGVFIFSTGTNKKSDSFPMFLPAEMLNAEIFLLNKKEPVRLSDYRNKPVVLFFLETWCFPCRQQAEELKSLYSQISSKIEIIGLSSEINPDDKKGFREFADRYDFKYQLGWSGEKLFESAIKISKFNAIPQTFLIYDGKLYGVFRGGSVEINREIKETVERLLKENNL